MPNFSYLSYIDEDIDSLKSAVTGCRGTSVANIATKATRDLEELLQIKRLMVMY